MPVLDRGRGSGTCGQFRTIRDRTRKRVPTEIPLSRFCLEGAVDELADLRLFIRILVTTPCVRTGPRMSPCGAGCFADAQTHIAHGGVCAL